MAKTSFLMSQLEKERDRLIREFTAKRYSDFNFARQLFADLSQIALNEAFGFGEEEIAKFIAALSPLHDEFCDLWNADTEDVEYSMTKLDQRLRECCGSRFIPHEERYSNTIPNSNKNE